MDSLVQTVNYGTTNTSYPTTIGYYVVKYVMDAYILQEETKCDGKISTDGELVVRDQCMICTK